MKKDNGYQNLKKAALGCYDTFLNFIAEAHIPQEGNSFEELKDQAKRIKADQFRLMIAGEAKSGKSTFINAYLGQDILPMDVLQCSSSVVEIKYGEKLTLKAFYADGYNECIEGKQAIQKFLHKHAAVDDNYRDIPVNTINNELILKRRNESITPKMIDVLIKEVEKENIHHLSSEVYDKKIRDYIQIMKKNWGKIVTQMIITYPFEEESMRGISVIDSPGVNAAGRVGDVTAAYLETADAIMFLRPITGVAVEASSFKDFLESKSVDRNPNAMFLILTRAAAESQVNIQRACDEFVKMFGAQTMENRHGISRGQIIPVDSKAELYFNKFQTMTKSEIKAGIKKLRQNGETENFLPVAYFDALEEEELGNSKSFKELFLENLEKQSNFAAIDQALNRFGRKAKYIALQDFIQNINRVYEKCEANLMDEMQFYQMKVRNPGKFSEGIKKTKTDLDNLKTLMHSALEEIDNEYTSSGTRGGKIEKDADEVVQKYKEEVEQINEKSSYRFEQLEKISFRQVDIFRTYQKKLSDELLQECNTKLKMTLQGGLVSYIALQPDFTKESLEKVKNQLKEKATEKRWEDGGCFSKKRKVPRFSEAKYYELVKKDIMKRIEDIKGTAIKTMRDFVEKVIDSYRTQLIENIESKKSELQKIEEDQRKNDEIIKWLKGKEQLLTKMSNNKNDLRDYGTMIDDVLKSSQN